MNMYRSGYDYQALELEQVPCPICSSREFDELAKVDRYRMGITTSGCRGCGLVMTNPRPGIAAMDDFYRFHYRNYYESVDVPSQEYIRKIHKDVRASYTVDYLEQAGVLRETGRVLDFGCGEGSLLREMSARWPGLETEAVEPGETFREFAREFAACKIYPGLDELRASSEGNFDLITVNHVLEHIMQPNELLLELGQLLSDNGRIFIDVPAIEGYRSVESLHIGHMYHFSENALKKLAAATGYRVAVIEPHLPPLHPVSTRCLLAAGTFQGDDHDSADEDREACWPRIREIQRTAWKFYLMSSFIVKAIMYIPRRLAGKSVREGG